MEIQTGKKANFNDFPTLKQMECQTLDILKLVLGPKRQTSNQEKRQD